MRLRLLIGLAAVAILVSSCGSKSKTALVRTNKNVPTAVAQTMNITADSGGKLKFDKAQLKTSAGTLQIVMTNPSSVPHDIAIKGNGVNTKGKIVQGGGRSTVTATLRPGTYEFYCSVDGHEKAGMKGKLLVGKSA